MDTELRLKMSFYRTIATINDTHKVYIVQNINNKHIYVKKVLDVYNKNVYEYLYGNPIKGIPHIFEIFQEADSLTIIEEYISGNTLEELIEDKKSFSVTNIKNICTQLCSILEMLHNAEPPIIHRDIKPSNIIITNDDSVVLLDLNAAKHVSSDKSEDTTLLGTKGYAAPEQYGFGSSNPQTDIYALGMVMNTLLYKEFSPVPYPESELTPIIKKCIQLNPNDRYKSVSLLKRHLKNQYEIPSISGSGIQKFLPPGLRSGNPFMIAVSSFLYIFLVWICLSLEIKDATTGVLISERICSLFVFLGIILISGNYLNIHKYVPLCNSKNFFIKRIGIIMLNILYVFVVILTQLMLLSFIQ